MSLTQLAFLKKAEVINSTTLENKINELGYDFKILENFDSLYEVDVIQCSINGHKTFFEIYYENPNDIIDDFDWIKPDLTNENLVISFVWGADFVAGAGIALISIFLIDKFNALIYYLDDEMKYTREMLLDDITQYINEFEETENKSNLWDRFINFFR